MRNILLVILVAMFAACSGAGPNKVGSFGDTRRAAPPASYELQPTESVPPPVAKTPRASVLPAPYVADTYSKKGVAAKKAPKVGWENAARKVGNVHYTFFIDQVYLGGSSSAKEVKVGDSVGGDTEPPTNNGYKLEARLPQGMSTSLASAPPAEKGVDVFTPEFKAVAGGYGLAAATLFFGLVAGGFAVWRFLSGRQPKRP